MEVTVTDLQNAGTAISQAMQAVEAANAAAADTRSELRPEVLQQRRAEAAQALREAIANAQTLHSAAQAQTEALRRRADTADPIEQLSGESLRLAHDLAPFIREDFETLPLDVLAARIGPRTGRPHHPHELALYARYGQRRLDSVPREEQLSAGYRALKEAVASVRSKAVPQGAYAEAAKLEEAATALMSSYAKDAIKMRYMNDAAGYRAA